MTIPSAKVVLDSISVEGNRLITFEGVMHRIVLSEFNTHRAFSRNSASSRAIPIKKQIERVKNDPALPVEWGKNQPGMQANEVLSPDDIELAKRAWLRARDNAVLEVEHLEKIGLHKQLSNRLLEPWMWHTVVFTTSMSGLDNFFRQRCTSYSPLAQPEMRAFADAVLVAFEASAPVLEHGWHTPYIQPDEDFSLEERKQISAARCARVSYLTHDGVRDPSKDLDMYQKLISARPMHASPLEHVAIPSFDYLTSAMGSVPSFSWSSSPGNFIGWKQLRHDVERGQYFANLEETA